MLAISLGIGSHWLDAPAAASYLRMVADGCPSGITSAGRTNAEQVDIFLSRYTTNYAASSKKDRRVWQGRTYWRLAGVASAANPGTSNHEDGRALDLPDAPEAWVRAHGAAYGWIADRVPGEPWHVEYRPTAQQLEEDMATAQEIALAVLGYKNPAVKNGTEDVYLIIRKGLWAGEEARDTAKRTEVKVDAIIAALAKAPGASIDVAALASQVADAVSESVADDVADELGKRLGG